MENDECVDESGAFYHVKGRRIINRCGQRAGYGQGVIETPGYFT